MSDIDDAVKWLRVLAFDKIVPKLENLTDTEKKIYELSKEDNSVRDIAEKVESNKDEISSKKKSWYSKGMMESTTVRGGNKRYIRLDSLKKFGLEAPEIDDKGDQDDE